MKCLRCGYCCLTMLIPIIIDPNKGFKENNVDLLDGTKHCPHLKGDKPGNYSCNIHHYKWFKDTPCGQYTQIESSNSNCRTGNYKLS
jgi:hypothetical protein